MIKIGIDPVILHLGFFSLRWYSLAILAAALTGIWWTVSAFKKEGLKTDPIYTICLWALPGGIVGSRLIHILDQIGYYASNPGATLGGQGESITGAILGGVVAAFIGAKVHKLDFWKIGDLAAPGLLLAQAIGRIGCTINGDAIGKATDLPWGLIYTHPNSYAGTLMNTPTHPAVWYEMAWDLIVFGILLRLRGKIAPAGSIIISYIVLYSFGRFFIDFYRYQGGAAGLHQAQVMTLLVLIIFIPILIIRTHWVSKLPTSRKQAGKKS